MGYNEGNRYLYLETPLGDSQLLLQAFTGSEGLSQLYDFQLELLADNATTINFDQLIGQKVSFGVLGAESSLIARDFNGIVVEFMQGLRDREFTAYRMRVAPDIWKLTKKFQSRIFQHITVPDILKQILTGFDVSYEIQGTFEEREYCTQYRETDFDFLSRLMEEEGIYYFFKFTHGAHKLVLANTPPSHPDIPGDSKVIFETTGGGLREDERITWWQKEQIWGSGKYTTWDHHFQLPHKHLPAEATSGITVQVGKVAHKLNLARNEDLEIYDYPAAYAQRFDDIGRSGGEQGTLQKVFPDAKRTDDIRIQQQETPMLVIQATSNCRQMTAGHKFTLQRHYNGDGKYVVLRVSHDAAEADFRSAQSQQYENHYRNSLSCLPYELPFRPPMATEKPVIAGPQTAVVVGPGGEEIFTDKYGRVKVQFHWDRAGKYDGDSSCWLRVGTLFAGKQWGSVFIPRIGHEVIVGFIEGDPDRPIVIGSVYNADTVTPYELPANKTRSGVKTDSSLGSGGFNEIRFEDKKGSEQVFIHGQKDSDTRIENDSREWIGEDRHLIVKRDRYEEVDRDLHIDIKRDHKEKIEGDRNLTVQGKEAIQITGSQSLQVTGNVAEQFSANHSEQTTGSYYLQAQSIVLQGETSLCLTVGGNFISIGATGIAIMGMPAVLINSGGAAIPGVPGMLVSPAAPGKAIEADQAVAGSEVSYSGGEPETPTTGSGGGAGSGGGSAPGNVPETPAVTPPVTPPVTGCSVTIAPTALTICGTTTEKELNATGSPSGGSFTWSSEDTSIATVSGSGSKVKVKGVKAGKTKVKVSYSVGGCTCEAKADVKVCTCTQGRKYAYVLLSKAKLIGARSKITTKYGKLCCEIEGCSTVDAFHAVYTNISNHDSGLKWAQVGFSRRRNGGSSAIIQYRKAEIQGDHYYIDMDTSHAPAEGSTHEWKCELDKASGKWKYYDSNDGGTAWRTYQDDFWKSHLGADVQWTGEILNKEDDMPGTSGDKCSFTDCQYMVDGAAYVDAGIAAADVRSDDSGEWGAERVSGTAFNIWDKKPNT